MTEKKEMIAGRSPEAYEPKLVFIETDRRGFAKGVDSYTSRYVYRDCNPLWSAAEQYRAIKEIEAESKEGYTLEFAGIRPERQCLYRMWDPQPDVLPEYRRETAVCIVFESINGNALKEIVLKDIRHLRSVSVKHVKVPGSTNEGIQVGHTLVTFKVQDLRKMVECLDDRDELEIFVRPEPSKPIKPGEVSDG